MHRGATNLFNIKHLELANRVYLSVSLLLTNTCSCPRSASVSRTIYRLAMITSLKLGWMPSRIIHDYPQIYKIETDRLLAWQHQTTRLWHILWKGRQGVIIARIHGRGRPSLAFRSLYCFFMLPKLTTALGWSTINCSSLLWSTITKISLFGAGSSGN